MHIKLSSQGMSEQAYPWSPPPATASAEGAQLNGRPFPATASAEGAQFNVPPSLWERVRVSPRGEGVKNLSLMRMADVPGL
jgi:hypothetical protein